jgi:hypothetical protein
MLLDQLLPGQFGLWDLGASLLSVGVIALVIDYAYMLYMRSKLVSRNTHLFPTMF